MLSISKLGLDCDNPTHTTLIVEGFLVATNPGLEPGLMESNSIVLPLHQSAIKTPRHEAHWSTFWLLRWESNPRQTDNESVETPLLNSATMTTNTFWSVVGGKEMKNEKAKKAL